MTALLWGRVFYKDIYAGTLQEEPGDRYSFKYDIQYIEAGYPPLAYTLPVSTLPIITKSGLHPFFDNLVAEGWLEAAQARALGIDRNNRLALLLGYGYDLAGAVSVIDSEPRHRLNLDHQDKTTIAALEGRASLSGAQRKLLVVKNGKNYRLARNDELSTHIAKFHSAHGNLVELEYLTTLAIGALLPKDEIVEMEVVDNIADIQEQALVVKRFDRAPSGQRIHFEEFNQLLGRHSKDKFDGSYEDMAQFILKTSNGYTKEIEKLFGRILACFIVGNTDAHLKNFAMFHTRDGFKLTPSYDQVAYSTEYPNIALGVNGAKNLLIGRLLSKHILFLGNNFQLSEEIVIGAVHSLERQIDAALAAVTNSNIGNRIIKNSLIETMEKRWNGTFASIGQLLSKKRGVGEKHEV